ncbi:MAG: hypothetical protein VX252_00140 [Myxococcota bacterium]|nr:hypothetical protein [Myxococcota bacterium]
MRLRDDRKGTTHVVSPSVFFDRLEEEVGSARFVIEACTARFDSGYLFAHGLWVKPEGDAMLRAADFFTANEDGLFAALAVVWAAH